MGVGLKTCFPYWIHLQVHSVRNKFDILFENSEIVAIQKPAGYHVHAPEARAEKVPEHKIILQILRQQIGLWMYPLHRLDVPTTGVLIFAKSSEAASQWNLLLRDSTTIKSYSAIVRGLTDSEGEIDIPLLSDSSQNYLPASTRYMKLREVEIDYPVGKKHSTSRYSWLKVEIDTGRFHQIRRHMNRISHPVIGDSDHGDSRHNQFFREKLGVAGLCLHCDEIYIEKMDLRIQAPRPRKWKRLERIFNREIICERDGMIREVSKSPV